MLLILLLTYTVIILKCIKSFLIPTLLFMLLILGIEYFLCVVYRGTFLVLVNAAPHVWKCPTLFTCLSSFRSQLKNLSLGKASPASPVWVRSPHLFPWHPPLPFIVFITLSVILSLLSAF